VGDSAAPSAGEPTQPQEESAPVEAEAEGEPIVVGFAAGLAGEAANGDVPASEAMEYYAQVLNESGGIAGRPIKLIIKNMQSDTAVGAQVTQELLDEGAVVIVGPAFPGLAAGAIGVAAEAGVPVISGVATQPEYAVIGGAPAYLAAFGDNVQAAAVAEYALKQGFKTVVTITSPEITYTSNTPEWFVETFEKGGGKRISNINYSIGQEDFSPQVTEIANLQPQPDVIYTAMFMPDIGVFVKQLRDAGVTAPVYGPDGFDSVELLKFAGEALDGTVFSTHGYAVPGSKFAEFIEGLNKHLGRPTEAPGLATLGADALLIIKAAIEAAGSTEPEDIAAALAELEDVELITGRITYKGNNGVPLKTVTVVGVENGQFVFKDAYVPSYIPKP
jgi:branched-chain amino acid transport system substrate-binding protein